MSHTIFIAGSSTLARQLALYLDDRRWDVVTLLGDGGDVKLPAGRMCPPGVKDPAQIARFFATEHVEVLVDADDPFRSSIRDGVREAARVAGIPVVTFRQPGFHDVESHAQVIWVADALSAANEVTDRGFHHVFLADGRIDLGAFKKDRDNLYLVRVASRPTSSMPGPRRCRWVTHLPVAEIADAKQMYVGNQIDCVVVTDTGEKAFLSELYAAGQFGIPIIVIERPSSWSAGVRATASNLQEMCRLLGLEKA